METLLGALWLSAAMALLVAGASGIQCARILQVRSSDGSSAHRTHRRVVAAGVVGVGIGLIVALIVGIAEVRSSTADWPPDVLGYGQAFSPLAGTAAALLVLMLPTQKLESSPAIRTVDLSVGRRNYVRRSDSVALVVAVILLSVATIAIGSTATGAGQSFARSIFVVNGGTTNEGEGFSPSFVVAVIASVLILAFFLWATLMRVRHLPGIGNASRQNEDDNVRRTFVSFALRLSVAGLGLALATVLWHTGSVVWSASFFPVIGHCHALSASSSICSQVAMNFAQPAHLIGFVEIVAGILAFAVSSLEVVRLIGQP